jgi:deoxyribonuclease-4
MDMNKNYLGVHISISDSISSIFKKADDLGVSYIQCFTGNRIQFSEKRNFNVDLLEKYNEERKKYSDKVVFSHSAYVINLASEDEELRKKSENALLAEFYRCHELNIFSTTLHPGTNINRKLGIKKIIESITSVMNKFEFEVKILIENSAGQGNSLPATVEEIYEIYNGFSDDIKKKVGLTIDTCHAHASGYDFSNELAQRKFWNFLKKEIGLDVIKLIHLNDSKRECSSKIDRHENIGLGTISEEGFEFLLKEKDLIKIPKILETPHEIIDDYKKDLKVLYNLIER